MSRIRSAGTTPEKTLYEIVRQNIGGRRRIDRNVRGLPGQPDVVVPSLRLAIFADGCFYHGCPVHGHIPKSNMKYWIPKLARNRKRDKWAQVELRKRGLKVLRVWECDLSGKRLPPTVRRLNVRLKQMVANGKNSRAFSAVATRG
jgi:DNA mismatch endonuclease (patch repair protein)